MKTQEVYMMFLVSIIFLSNVLIVVTESAPIDIVSEITLLKDQIQIRDNYFGEKLAELEDKLHKAEENTKSVEIKFQKKLTEAEERRKSAEKFFEKKITDLENKLSETTESGYKADQTINDGNLHEVIDTSYAVEGSFIEKEIAEFEVDPEEKSAMKPFKDNRTEARFVTEDHVSHKIPVFNSQIYEKRMLLSPGSHRVAFSSHLSATATELGKEHTIPFDLVLLNEGQSFDTVLHAFICPVNGIYMFQSSLFCEYGDHIQTEIVKDGSVLARIYAAGDSGLPNGWDQGFNSATVQCNRGERVWVRVHAHYGTAAAASKFSTFSGFLIWEI